ncbi:hypothetical protein DGG96_11135 [Legionella qingyii]|uniref:Ankyrin repeat domain-containing protein n=1 Tax=Legionella qingyii TaxID=2184757 RepID=A0A317U5K0_9GAMM|nr:ankyrin repeat domain-containing protein [Legionella qingyii]PWY55650.1 hypothetical protein DGG96_11135 [Legionella qingyii]RUR21756.1 ankyrin repeat domain-containing protein [Legionella qingyii]RUR25316.1 ankyrin repeat domain-containing protein [Legionella qingyii]
MSREITQVINEYKAFLLQRKQDIETSFRLLNSVDETDDEPSSSNVSASESEDSSSTDSLREDEEGVTTSESEESSTNSLQDDEEYQFITKQIEMLESCYDSKNQIMVISEQTGYPYYHEDVNGLWLYQIEKFLYHMGQAAKKGVKQLSISQECPSHNHLWDFIENNQDLSVLTIDSEFFDGTFLESDYFFRALQTAPNLYYIQVFVGEDENPPDMEVVKEKLIARMPERPFIFSWGHSGECTTLIKKANSSDIFCTNEDEYASNEQTFDEEALNEEQFIQRLSAKETFGLPLLFQALNEKIIGEFCDETLDLSDATIIEEQEYDSWGLLDYAVLYDDVLSTRFLLHRGFDPSRTNSANVSPLELAAEQASLPVLNALFDLSPSESYLSSEKLPLLRSKNIQGQTLLTIAAGKGRMEAVQFFLQYDISLGQDIKLQQEAIDSAWKNQHFDLVLYLLKHNFPFPNNFSLSQAQSSKALNAFAAKRQLLHDQIQQGDLRSIEHCTFAGEQIGYCFNIENTSALDTALSSKQYKIYAYLKTKGFKGRESENLQQRINDLNEHEKTALNKALVRYFNKPSDTSVYYLLSRSRTMQRESIYFNTIRFMYEQLVNSPGIAPFLSVIEHYKGTIDIIFDFNQVNTVDLDVTSYSSTEGRCCYEEGRIFIAAKLDQQELLGNIAHEIVHLAIQILFKNECKPYRCDTIDVNYRQITEACSRLDLKAIDKIISLAFTAYQPSNWDAELIVRVPHILAKYGDESGLLLLQTQVPELLNYYNQVLIPACNAFTERSINLNADRQVMESRRNTNPHFFWENSPAASSSSGSRELRASSSSPSSFVTK